MLFSYDTLYKLLVKYNDYNLKLLTNKQIFQIIPNFIVGGQ